MALLCHTKHFDMPVLQWQVSHRLLLLPVSIQRPFQGQLNLAPAQWYIYTEDWRFSPSSFFLRQKATRLSFHHIHTTSYSPRRFKTNLVLVLTDNQSNNVQQQRQGHRIDDQGRCSTHPEHSGTSLPRSATSDGYPADSTSQATGGKDMSGGGFAARAQSAADKNENTSAAGGNAGGNAGGQSGGQKK